MSPPETSVRRSGAALGIVVFLVGVAIVGYVFLAARTLFDTPLPALPIPAPTPSPSAGANTATATDATNAATALGGILADFGRQIVVLLLMCIAGSVIASRGVELFFKACAAAPPVVRPAKGTPAVQSGASAASGVEAP